KTNLNINTAALATFEVVNGAHTVGAIAGSGTTQVDAGANLTAQSINQGTLTIASGATVTIQAIPGGPLALSDNLQPVPEPSTLVLIGMGSIGLLAYTRRWSCVRLPKSELSGKGKLPVNGSLPGRGGRPGLCPLSCI
ncbi:MAG: PEP-CTERM sorting domain-containing protein, partial [Thermoguttaceae bacterium]